MCELEGWLPVRIDRLRVPGVLAAILLALVLSGCGSASVGCSTTCNPDERFPPGVVRFAERHVEAVVAGGGRGARYRDGRLLGNREAADYIATLAQPADIIATANRGTLSGRLIPGYFTHSAAYLGTEAQLRALGLWEHPAIKPLHADILAGKKVIHASDKDVHLASLTDVLDADRVLLVRPGGEQGLSRRDRRKSVVALASRMGMPFDFHFDATTPHELFCVELIQRSIPTIKLDVETIYGRPTIKPVAIAEAVFRSDSNLSFVTYLKGSKGGFQGVSREDLRGELAEAEAKDMERAGCGGPQTAVPTIRETARASR